MVASWVDPLHAWYTALPPDMKFLFALPFLVAAVGLVADWVRGRSGNG